MALECRIIRTADGSIDYVNTEEGTRSALFDNLANQSNKDVALNLYALTETEEFKEVIPDTGSEPSVEEVLTYASQRDTVLDEDQVRDVENTILSSGYTTYGELLNKLKSIFVKNGIVVFDRASLENSGFYNQYEVESIINDITLQNQIKSTINGLKNSDESVMPNYDPLFVVSQTSRINSLGKQDVSNPYIIEQQVVETIAGTDVSESIVNLPFENIKNQYFNNPSVKTRFDNVANKTKNVIQKEIVDGVLVNKSANRTKEILQETLDLADRSKLNDKIGYLRGISATTWNQAPDAIYTLLKDLNSASVNAGVDFLNLEDSAYTDSRPRIMRLLTAYSNLLNTPTDETLTQFSDQYSEFFELPTDTLTKTVVSNDAGDIYLETDMTEYQLFTEHGLIKKGENLYREVEVMSSLDDTYMVMAANTTLLPVGVENEQQLRDYVDAQISTIPIPDFEVDIDTLQKMLLYKMYFRSSTTQPIVSDTTDNYLQFTGDYNYLTEEYPSDFYKEMIKEKRKNSDIYKNFYSNFKITSKGIELINTDPITMRNVLRFAPDNLIQYNLISKSLNLPVEAIENPPVNFDQMSYNRQQAISNPDGVPKLNKDYTILSPVVIAVKNESTNFVRTPMGVYEIDYQIGNVSFYNMLPQGDTRYNGLSVYNSKTQPDINQNDFAYLQDTPEAFTRAQNYYSAAELRRINERYFNC